MVKDFILLRRGPRGHAKDADGSEENGLEIQISLRTLRILSGLCVKKNLDKEIRGKAMLDFFFSAEDPEDAQRTRRELVFYQCKK